MEQDVRATNRALRAAMPHVEHWCRTRRAPSGAAAGVGDSGRDGPEPRMRAAMREAVAGGHRGSITVSLARERRGSGTGMFGSRSYDSVALFVVGHGPEGLALEAGAPLGQGGPLVFSSVHKLLAHLNRLCA